MIRFTVAGIVVLSLAVPATSQAAVDVLQGDEEGNVTTLVSFKTAKCRKASRKGAFLKFAADAKRGGWTLRVNVFTRAREMDLVYGSDGPADFTVTGPGGTFTNLNRPPNAPPGGGAIVFNAKRTRMGLGFQPTFNEDLSGSVDVGGALKCKYPKKKRRRR